MRAIEARIEIDASAERVWQVLCDVVAYPGWNPFIRRVSDAFLEGRRPTLDIAVGGPLRLPIRSLVWRAHPPRELSFRSRLLGGAFQTEHTFLIEAQAGASVTFVQRESFGGILGLLLLMTARRSTCRGFEAMNAALKRVAERTPE